MRTVLNFHRTKKCKIVQIYNIPPIWSLSNPQISVSKCLTEWENFPCLTCTKTYNRTSVFLGCFFNVFENRFWYLYFWNFVSIKQFQVCFTCMKTSNKFQVSPAWTPPAVPQCLSPPLSVETESPNSWTFISCYAIAKKIVLKQYLKML